MFNSRSSISISTFLSSLIGSIMRGRRSVRCGQTCEYRKARLILTHDPGEEAVSGGPSSGCGSFPGTYRYPRTHRRTCYLSQSARGGRSEGTHGTSDPARRNRRGRETRRPDEGWRTCAASRPVFSPSTPRTSLRKQPGSRRSTDNPFSPRHRLGTWFVSFCDNRSSGCRKRRSTRVSRPNIPKTP